ncbi:uncharacterized protein C1orf105 homolog isoform X2 [Tamandua tetradactyla]|uniref:uncharacterized protein C1orf105 homolog isoform X2 n=1 Tax=Tamandua tetradactyla TaxID=48850 RepID=UPI0040538699
MEKRKLKVSVPKFGKIPWLSEASLINKPLVLSLPKRTPQSSSTFLVSSKKNTAVPILFQVPDGLSKARRRQSDTALLRNKVQPRTVIIPDDLKLSYESFMNQKMMSIQPPKAQALPRSSPDDIPTESVHYRLPILGPRTSVFHGLLSETYKTLQQTQLQLSSFPRKELVSKTMRQSVAGACHFSDS